MIEWLRAVLSVGVLLSPLLGSGPVHAGLSGGAPPVADGGPPSTAPATQGDPPTAAASPGGSSNLSSLPTFSTNDEAPSDSGTRRPRFCMAMSMGISRDSSGLVDQRTVSIPSFQAQVGVGEGFLGFELRLFSNQAAGRYHQKASASVAPAGTTPAADTAVDRLALDLMAALRPLAFRLREAPGWWSRAARSLALNVGFAAESDSVGPPSVRRYGPIVGGHIDFPLTRFEDATDLRARLSARRLFGGQAHAGTVGVADTKAEIFGGLALVF